MAEISSLSMLAFPFRPPGARVVDLKGVFPFNNDSVWWKSAYAALPNHRPRDRTCKTRASAAMRELSLT